MPHSPDRRIIRAKAVQILMVALAWVALCGLAVVAASAQDLDLIVAAEKQAAETRGALDRVASEIGDPALTPAVLSDKRQVLDAIKSATLSLVPRLQSASAEVGARRNQLGPAPPAGTGEPVAIAAERKALSDLLGRYVAAEKQLTLMAVEADQLEDQPSGTHSRSDCRGGVDARKRGAWPAARPKGFAGAACGRAHQLRPAVAAVVDAGDRAPRIRLRARRHNRHS
jgi:hypothetical protein